MHSPSDWPLTRIPSTRKPSVADEEEESRNCMYRSLVTPSVNCEWR